MRKTASALAALCLVAVLGACGDGEDRPGTVSEEGSSSASGSASASASASSAGEEGHTEEHEEPKELAFPETEATQVVEVELVDFAFEGLPASIKGTKVFFELANTADKEHEMEILDSSGEAVDELYLDAGKSGDLAVELPAGEYTVQCILEVDGTSHLDLGMKGAFTVTA